MRAIQIAIAVICIQMGIGIVAVSGLFGNMYYESSITKVNVSNPSSLSETEQTQTSINILNKVFDALSWGWITHYFEPWYSQSSSLASFIDTIVLFLRSISSIIIGIAFMEFIRNRVSSL